MAREISEGNTYQSKLLKLIPSEVIAAYLVISGIIPKNAEKWGLLIVTLALLVLIPFYLWRVQCVRNILQIIITTVSFIIWTYSLNGGAFLSWGLYQSWIASVILILWTLFIPVVFIDKK